MTLSSEIQTILAPHTLVVSGQLRPEGQPMNGHGDGEYELTLQMGEGFSLFNDTGESLWIIPINLEKPEVIIKGMTYVYLKRILSNF